MKDDKKVKEELEKFRKTKIAYLNPEDKKLDFSKPSSDKKKSNEKK